MEMSNLPAVPDGNGLPTDLVAGLAQLGDAESCNALFRRVAPAVYAWARLHVRAPLRARLDPDDVLQEVSCRAFANFAAWDRAKGPFRAFVFGIAKNVLRKALERLAREPAGARVAPHTSGVGPEVLDTATTLTRAIARDDSLLRLVEQIERLPEDERRLLLHRGLEGLGHEEVARLFGTSTETVKKRWQRLCERLRQEPRFQEIVAA